MRDREVHPLPTTIEEIDRDWLTSALRTRAPGVTVRDYEIVDMKRGTCTKVRLRLHMDHAGKRAGIPETVVLKGGFEPHSRDMAVMHEREARGYRDVFPVLKLPTPACYFADYAADQRQGIVIMEDLVARGVTFCDPLRPHSHEQVARRLGVLARYHAQTWNSPDFAPGGRWGWAEDVIATTPKYYAPYLAPSQWERFVNAPRGAAVAKRFLDRDWIHDTFGRMLSLSRQVPQVLVHGDTHLANLYCGPDDAPGFFDSLPGRSPAMEEIAYHVVCALDLADRQSWEGALVRHYLDELARNGVANPPGFDDAMRQFGAFMARGFIIFLFNESFFQAEAINTAYTARFSAAMLDHDTMGLLSAIN
jgi:hypothetical protein